jgi:hypothetical protein
LWALVASLVCLAVWAAPAVAAPFRDVPGTHRFRTSIEVLAQLGVVSGYADGTFRPDAPVTRQQFAKMVVLAMRIPASESDISTFTDVQKGGAATLFPDNYIAAAAREGVVKGKTVNGVPVFQPGAPILLAQAVTMVTRSAGEALGEPPSSYRSVWGDFDRSHGATARLAQYNGLLRYFPLQLSPWKQATRGETAALLFNLMGTDPKGMNGLFLGMSDDLVTYFRAQGRTAEKFNVPLKDLAKLYVVYGRRFGIRADMAWAQMVHETGFGEYGGDVKPEQNNMAGIGATGGGVPGNSFASAELGVIAHYAHLAWYVYPDHLDDPYCVSSTDPTKPGDPRHFVSGGRVHRGNVRTVLDLSGKWAPGAEYGARVLSHSQGIGQTRGW